MCVTLILLLSFLPLFWKELSETDNCLAGIVSEVVFSLILSLLIFTWSTLPTDSCCAFCTGTPSDELVSFNNRPFQGSYRHIAGGAKTLGRARGHQWRPYYLLVSERKLPFEILPFFSKNVYISISNSYFLDNR